MGTIDSGQNFIDLEYGNIGGADSTDKSWAMYPLTRTLRGQVPADLATGVAGTFVIGAPNVAQNPYGGNSVTTQFRVVAARVISPGALTSDSTNFATFTINRYPSAGTTATAVSVISTTPTGTGTLVVGQRVAMSLTAANTMMDQNGTLVCVVGKSNATGVTVLAGTVVEVDVAPVA